MFGVTKDPLHSKHLLGSLEVDWAVELSSGMAVHNAKQNENNIQLFKEVKVNRKIVCTVN